MFSIQNLSVKFIFLNIPCYKCEFHITLSKFICSMEKTYLINDILNAMDQINSKNINFTNKKKPIVKKKKDKKLLVLKTLIDGNNKVVKL